VRLASIVSIAVLAVACSVSACGGGGEGDGASPSATVATERPTSSAELSIASPRNVERVTGDSVRLEIDLQGAEVVEQTSTDLRPDEGHLHVMLDGTLVSMTSGTSQRLTDLTPGEHLLQVEFVANDHAPFDPRVLAAVTFEVRP
jgi:hypothetical protein